ncbi:diguanylate cyclase [Devosia pacifica]|uniref:Diguanylate cyclase n=1 Tax=Devosia pacifica TaxID=1335967 RepID=A0A918VV73_9HYPH|nr:EAL domain-containing protein [Devosia pacifica]GHA26153.1 diguanylate cyclase [Devosia pacifica]
MASQNTAHENRENLWVHAIRRARLGVWDWNVQTGDCRYSDSWFEMLGYKPGELTEDSDLWINLTHPDDRDRAIASGDRHIVGGARDIETELRLRHKDGHWIWVLDRGGIIEWDRAGKPLRVVGVQTDISAQKRAEADLTEVNERFSLALDASDIGIWQFDRDSKQSYWDDRTKGIFGLQPNDPDLNIKDWHDFLHPDDKLEAERAHEETGNEPRQIQYRIIRADGAVRHVETLARLVPVPGTSGRLTGTIRDITEEREREKQLAWAAQHDALTGLYNRTAFQASLEHRIANAEQQPIALLYLDLDYFKAINDSAGHAMGDWTLKQIASELRQLLADATIARLGGDEFTIILCLREDSPAQIAEQIIALIRGVGRNASYKTELGASIGISEIRSSKISVSEALAQADDACYRAKRAGRNQWAIFQNEHHLWSGMTAAHLAADIADARSEDRLKLYGQEIRSLDAPFAPADRIEVLARLVSRDGRFIPPGEFIPAAERFGVAAALDRWVFQSALQQFGARLGRVTLAFNLSGQTLSDPGLWDFVEQVRDGADVSPNNIVFEITETAAVTTIDTAQSFLNRARRQGYKVALDDFGAGLSSFSYLRQFPVDAIKIDGSFTGQVTSSRLDQEVVRSMCQIASVFGYDLIAERIEDEDTLATLRGLGVSLGQGFLMHRPEPLANVVERIVGSRQSRSAG